LHYVLRFFIGESVGGRDFYPALFHLSPGFAPAVLSTFMAETGIIMRTALFVTFFSLIISSNALPQLPACKDSFPISLLRNHSFEEYSGCYSDNASSLEGGYIDGLAGFGGIAVYNWHSFTDQNYEVHYFNYNCRSNKPESIFDSLLAYYCYGYPQVPFPLPDGPGFISINENDLKVDNPENKIFKNYITACLTQPLVAGTTYVLSFYFGFGKQLEYCFQRSLSPYGVALFGREDCPPFPLHYPGLNQGCLSNNVGWVQLGRVTVKGQNEWVSGSIEFTPKNNISSIGIGADCLNHNLDSLYYMAAAGQMHFMDKFILASKKDYSFKTITAISGDVCTGHFVLKSPIYTGAAYQWYKDGLILTGATSEIYKVPDNDAAEGNYVVNIQHPDFCINSLPFSVIFSELNKLTLGPDILLCDTGTITLNASLQTAINYVWQDGSNNQTLNVNKSGSYWVQVTDVNGCTKEDSMNVTIQNCDQCRLLIPSAFTPNSDGLNDLFKIRQQCPNIGLLGFTLRVYNRWGQLVFMTNDINTGWDGTYRSKRLDQDVYVYLVEYSLKQNRTLQQRGTIALVR
jgi:gliding motility-associated-like protein